jgi:hypothetical protein
VILLQHDIATLLQPDFSFRNLADHQFDYGAVLVQHCNPQIQKGQMIFICRAGFYMQKRGSEKEKVTSEMLRKSTSA